MLLVKIIVVMKLSISFSIIFLVFIIYNFEDFYKLLYSVIVPTYNKKRQFFSFLIKYFGYLVHVTNCLYSVLILCKGFEGILLQSKKWGHSSKRRKVCLTYFVYSIVNVVVLN